MTLRTQFPDAGQSPGLLLWQVGNSWQAAQRRALKPFELTHVQFVLLASLSWLASSGPVTQQRLADHAAMDPMMTSQVLRALEARGLLSRRTHPTDGRAKTLQLASAGAALVNRAILAVEACDREFFGALGAEEVRFTSLLARLRRSAPTFSETDDDRGVKLPSAPPNPC